MSSHHEHVTTERCCGTRLTVRRSRILIILNVYPNIKTWKLFSNLLIPTPPVWFWILSQYSYSFIHRFVNSICWIKSLNDLIENSIILIFWLVLWYSEKFIFIVSCIKPVAKKFYIQSTLSWSHDVIIW